MTTSQRLFHALPGATRSGHVGGLVLQGSRLVAECPHGLKDAMELARDLNELEDRRAHGDARIAGNELRRIVLLLQTLGADFAKDEDSPFRGVTARDVRGAIRAQCARALELIAEND